MSRGTLLHNYAHIFELLSRLRQAVDHPYLVVHGEYRGSLQKIPSKSSVGSDAGGASDVCGICGMDILSLKDATLSSCRHTFHKACIQEHIEHIKSLSERAEEAKLATSGKGSGKGSKKKKKTGKKAASSTRKRKTSRRNQ